MHLSNTARIRPLQVCVGDGEAGVFKSDEFRVLGLALHVRPEWRGLHVCPEWGGLSLWIANSIVVASLHWEFNACGTALHAILRIVIHFEENTSSFVCLFIYSHDYF